MAVKCQTIISEIEKLAPKSLAQEWDNVGLMLGSYTDDVEKVLVCLDVTRRVVDEAVQIEADLIVSHHPFIFTSIKSISKDSPTGEMVYKLIKNEISVYSAHTNLDIAAKGVNYLLAEKLNLKNHEVLQITAKENLFKLAVFVPSDYADKIRNVLGDCGAGWIGNYSHCSFQTKGLGAFKPLEGANPFTGNVGKLERVEEVKIETIVPQKLLNKTVNAMIKAHPYEEVAYDVYPLKNQGKVFGLGRIGYLEQEMMLMDFVKEVKKVLGIHKVKVVGDQNRNIKKVAVCGGSGASCINMAVFKGADVLVTGDIKYHEAHGAIAQGLAIIDAGHWATEIIVVPYLVNYLSSKFSNAKPSITVVGSKVNEDPFYWL